MNAVTLSSVRRHMTVHIVPRGPTDQFSLVVETKP